VGRSQFFEIMYLWMISFTKLYSTSHLDNKIKISKKANIDSAVNKFAKSHNPHNKNYKGLYWSIRSKQYASLPMYKNERNHKRTIYWSKRSDELDVKDFLPFFTIISHQDLIKDDNIQISKKADIDSAEGVRMLKAVRELNSGWKKSGSITQNLRYDSDN
jgi:hypothetical protein